MNTTLPETTENFIAIKLSGKLNQQDYAEMIPEMKRRIEAHGKLSVYLELEDFEGWTLKGFWQEMKFDMEHRNDFERIAVVCESRLQKMATQISSPFTSAEVRYYKPEEKRVGHTWAKFGE